MLATLVGDFNLAEEALQDAHTAAVERWSHDGIPANPYAWLVSTGRFKAIDRFRRRARNDAMLGELASRISDHSMDPVEQDDRGLPDDRLRLIFTCCHPTRRPPVPPWSL